MAGEGVPAFDASCTDRGSRTGTVRSGVSRDDVRFQHPGSEECVCAAAPVGFLNMHSVVALNMLVVTYATYF